MMTEDDLTALNDGLIGAVHIGAQQVRVDTDHAISLIAMARDSLELRAQLAAMAAERDALVGAAYAASAEWCRKKERHGSIPAYNILRLTPADAAAALDHIRAQAKAEGRKEGMREAADIAEDYCSDMPDLAGHGHSVGIRDAILAAAQKEAGK